uniref:Capsid protein n=1 Tax=Chimpanzee anellovirus TaxID=1743410 RepID=A0A0S2GMK7_9VIRU|nr:ORF1 [Chimpanzee anellovirus]
MWIYANPLRLANNYAQYEASTIPEHQPGGGSFSIYRFTLEALYEQFTLVRNWWTQSNNGLPLIRYRGCKLKLYRSDDVDYVVRYCNCFPMSDTELMHISAQPSVMMLNNQKILVPSKKTKPRGKPYVIKRIPPPSQMLTKWFFQKDIARTGLLMTTISAASFDHYFIDSWAQSTNATVTSLNTTIFQSRNFQNLGTTGYVPKPQYYMYATTNGSDNPQVKELIYLGNTLLRQQGTVINNTNLQDYNTKPEYWGNPFWHMYLNKNVTLWVGKTSHTDLFKQNNLTKRVSPEFLTKMEQELIIKCRYNPERDTGVGNKIYILKNTRNESGWDPPSNDNLILEGFPLWLILFGWTDWQKKLGEAQQIDINYILVIQSNFLSPKLPYYVLIDNAFINNKSPFGQEDGDVTPSDNNHWYPKLNFQYSSINILVETGPGIPRFGNKKALESKFEYTFYFNFGGCPAKQELINDPSKQPQYPVPDNILQTTSLQSPETSIESYLYSFDERRGTITKRAAKRLKEYTDSEISLFTDGRQTALDPQVHKTTKAFKTQQDSTSDSEEEEETLFEQLQHHRRKQKLLRDRILRLVTTIQQLE